MERTNWNSRYLKMYNPKTGEYIIVDREDKLPHYKKMSRGFVNSSTMEGLTYFKHITLTQKEESYRPKILNDFMNQMRRRYGRLAYLWTIEIQEKRLERTGEAVLHWHIVFAFEHRTEFNREDIQIIQSFWKYGNVDVRHVPPHRLNLKYLLKYVQKSLASPIVDLKGYRLRRIGLSRIDYFYRYAKKQMIRVIEWFNFNMQEYGKFWKCDKKGIYYEWWDNIFERYRKDYALILNRWCIVGMFDGEPF